MKRARRKNSPKNPKKFKYFMLFFISFFVIGLDQLTKYFVVQKFILGESIPVVVNFFNITYVQNKGAAFGILSQADPSFRVPFFMIVPIAALVSIAYVFRKVPAQDLVLSAALSLVISGAVGNFIDRLTMGYVVDFLDFHWHWSYHFPAFNVADSAICIGVGILMLDVLSRDRSLSIKKESHSHVSNSH